MAKTKCLQCGKLFSAAPYRIEAGLAKYCSRKCWRIASRKQPDGNCPWCGKVFRKKLSRQKFCSTECARAGQQAAAQVTKLSKKVIPAGKGGSGFGLFDDPWKTGAVQPDRYGKDLYREPDFGLGF